MAGRFSRRLHGYAKAEGIPLARRVSRAIRMLVEFYDPMAQRKIVNSEGRFSENHVGREAIGPENSNEYNSSDFVTRLLFSSLVVGRRQLQEHVQRRGALSYDP